MLELVNDLIRKFGISISNTFESYKCNNSIQGKEYKRGHMLGCAFQ
jgi:hypothetical protein